MNQPGQIKKIGAIETVKDTFKKRELILDIPGQYPQVVKFEFVQDKCALLDGLKVGQNVNVFFNLNGREHNGNVYNTLSGWKVE
jgi:single-strand DNA-binding protein